jgi:hypothetical protein
MEENGHTVLAQTTAGIAGNHVPAIATRDFPDDASPSTTMADSGALLVKDVGLHISLSP